MDISLTDIEDAINYWRNRRPSTGEERALSPEVNTLATLYAIMIVRHSKALPIDEIDAASRQLIDHWRAHRDAPR